MAQFKGSGLVLRSINLGEWDKLLTIFAEGQGKIKVVAKGARKIQSRYASVTQPFCQIGFNVYHGKNIHTLSQVELIESFRPLREDLGRLAYGLYMLELADSTLEDGQSHDDILSLLVACLHILSYTEHLELLLAFYELRLLGRLGWPVSIAACPYCGAKPGSQMSIKSLGFICTACVSRERGEALVTLSGAALSLLKLLCNSDWLKVEDIPQGAAGEKELSAILDRVVFTKLEKRPESFAFLSQIRNNAR